MKIIEAMKKIKSNGEKIADLQQKIKANSAHLSYETPAYGDKQAAQVSEWLQAAMDISQDNIALQLSIQRTNLATLVPIQIGNNVVTKPIAAWVLRRRMYAVQDMAIWQSLTDRGLKEGTIGSTSQPGVTSMEVKIVRNFDPVLRDNKIVMYRDEPHLIDGALEVVNATTDLVEAA